MSSQIRGLIYNSCVCTKHSLKEAFTISYEKYGIHKNKLVGKTPEPEHKL